jgi:hypothetical protein
MTHRSSFLAKRATLSRLARLLLVGSTLFSATSCEKAPDEPLIQFKLTLISKSGWKLQKDEFQNDNGPITDSMIGRPACRKDDVTLFKSDNSMEVNEGTSKCDPLHPQIIAISSWNFSDNETKLQFGGGYTYNIEKLDNSNLILFYSNANGNSVSKRRLSYVQ